VEAGHNHVLSTDSEDCILEINVVMPNLDEKDNEKLPPANWEGVTVEDYD
jgi:hypothetical protein